VHNVNYLARSRITALRDAGESDIGYGQLALRNSIERGLIRGPRIVSAGNFVFALTGGHGRRRFTRPDKSLRVPQTLADTVDQVSVAVRRDIKFGADWIKLMATGGVMDPISDYTVQELSRNKWPRPLRLLTALEKKLWLTRKLRRH